MKNVEIVLENDHKVVQMGESVHGKVVVSFTGELPLSALQIGVVCMAKIKMADDTFDQKKLLDSFFQLPKSGKRTGAPFWTRSLECRYSTYMVMVPSNVSNELLMAPYRAQYCCQSG